jgi:predicted XRE-type DNA-binding protein
MMFTAKLIISNACEVAGIPESEWNSKTAEVAELRAIVVRWLYDYGMNEREIARLLGWSQQRVHERKMCQKNSWRIRATTAAFAERMKVFPTI